VDQGPDLLVIRPAKHVGDLQPPEPLALPVARIKRMCRALRVPQRTANDGRERTATVSRNAEQILH